ncbi:unnamed protein product [Caenorhabditis sp. 36 PRJEB53466]|nr:unnamed protein product [Caenorhabditis sp. 36 PRJEB53466]
MPPEFLVPLVDICGSSTAVHVFWGPEDARNWSVGREELDSRDSAYWRAYLTALAHALRTAIAEGIPNLIIRSRERNVHVAINAYQARKRSKAFLVNGTLTDMINSYLTLFKSVTHVLSSRRSMTIIGQMEAKRLAKEHVRQSSVKTVAMKETRLHSKSRTLIVTICGIATAEDGVARCGIFWKTSPECGWLGGQHGALCAEMFALARTIEKALSGPFTHIIVYTQMEEKGMADAFGKADRVHGKKCKKLDKLLDRLTVDVRIGCEHISRARELAESIRGYVQVLTFGELITGNNESTARYGVFWGSEEDPKNEVGWVNGEQSVARAKLCAIRRALEIAYHNKIFILIIRTNYNKKRDGKDERLLTDIRSYARKLETAPDITAEFRADWGPDDVKNDIGKVRGEQNVGKAKLLAIRRALETLIIRTDYDKKKDGKDDELMTDIWMFRERMELVLFDRLLSKDLSR